jgi:hypothetical protein
LELLLVVVAVPRVGVVIDRYIDEEWKFSSAEICFVCFVNPALFKDSE